MNYPACVFRDLSSAWHVDAASERVDILAAELAAQTAQAEGPLLVGLIKSEAVSKFYGLVYLLDSYGLLLRKRHRGESDGVYVYLERRPESVTSEFAGAVVVEKSLEPVLPELANAA